MVNLLAVDLGATSGRTVVGQFDGETLSINETHRFQNQPVKLNRHLHWNLLQIYTELQLGLLKSKHLGYTPFASMGIDSWAVDFGLLSKQGELLGNPIHYRDHQTDGMMKEVFEIIPQEEIFYRTGIQFMQINTLYHLYAMKQVNSPYLTQADSLLMIPELLRFLLTGEKRSEFTNATTTQLLSAYTKDWDEELIQKIGLPTGLFQEIVSPGTVVGSLRPSLQKEMGFAELPMIAVCEHDTASAVVSIPAEQSEFAYLSCGTWSLLGTEVTKPVINQQALAWNFTNEGGFAGTYRLLKNIMGLWLLEECQRIWAKEGNQLSYQEMINLADSAPAFQSLVDPDDVRFLNPDHMPKAIQAYCREANQTIPKTKGEILRCILESLALKYRFVLEKTEHLTGRTFVGLHMVGGGIHNQLLCQYTANAITRPVWAGPVEGTAIGNLLVQLITLEELKNIWEARQIVRKSFPIKTFMPEDEEKWLQAYKRFCELMVGAESRR